MYLEPLLVGNRPTPHGVWRSAEKALNNMRNRVLWGLIFIAAGVTILLVQVGVIPAAASELWPILVIVVGLWMTLESARSPGHRGLTGGIVATVAGGYWLAQNLGLLPSGLFFPSLLLALGLGLLLRSGVRAGR